MADLQPQSAADLIRLIPTALQAAVEAEQPLAILDLQADIVQAVTLEGKTATGANIGKYSTKPIYVSVDGAKAQFGSQIPTSKLKAAGKPRAGRKRGPKTRIVDGEAVPLRSKYFADGWSGFRSFMGRPVDKVNLKLTGNMIGSIASGTEGNVSTIGWTNDQAREIAEGNEVRFTGKKRTIIAASTDQIDRLFARLRGVADEALHKILP